MTLERALARIAELEEQIRALRRAERPPLPGGFQFSKHETTILGLLLARGAATRQTLIGAMYADRADTPEWEDRILSMEIHTLRKKIWSLGVRIRTIHRWGYDMSDASREKMRAAIDEMRTGSALS